METIYLNDFLDDGILREKIFREKVSNIDWSQYSDKRVLIKGCSYTNMGISYYHRRISSICEENIFW